MIVIKYIVLDSRGGGKDNGVVGNGIVEKDYSLLISKYIYDRLNEKGIKAYLLREDDSDISVDKRIETIRNEFGNSNDVLVISNQLSDVGSGIDVIYGLRNNDNLSSSIINNLYNSGFNVNDFYQLRDPNNSDLDLEKIIRDSKDNETIIIRYGNVNNYNDSLDIKNRWRDMAEDVVKSIILYTGNIYDEDGYYTVVVGDTLYSISKRFNISVDEIKRLNNLSSNLLSIGQVLKISSDGSNNNSSNYINYVVIKGDSLYAIAKKYNTTVEEIKRLNNLSSNLLSIGQVLKINSNGNSSNNNSINYIVVKGDSLYAIAKKYNTTVEEIKRLNNLNSNLLSIGQVLKIS